MQEVVLGMQPIGDPTAPPLQQPAAGRHCNDKPQMQGEVQGVQPPDTSMAQPLGSSHDGSQSPARVVEPASDTVAADMCDDAASRRILAHCGMEDDSSSMLDPKMPAHNKPGPLMKYLQPLDDAHLADSNSHSASPEKSHMDGAASSWTGSENERPSSREDTKSTGSGPASDFAELPNTHGHLPSVPALATPGSMPADLPIGSPVKQGLTALPPEPFQPCKAIVTFVQLPDSLQQQAASQRGEARIGSPLPPLHMPNAAKPHKWRLPAGNASLGRPPLPEVATVATAAEPDQPPDDKPDLRSQITSALLRLPLEYLSRMLFRRVPAIDAADMTHLAAPSSLEDMDVDVELRHHTPGSSQAADCPCQQDMIVDVDMPLQYQTPVVTQAACPNPGNADVEMRPQHHICSTIVTQPAAPSSEQDMAVEMPLQHQAPAVLSSRSAIPPAPEPHSSCGHAEGKKNNSADVGSCKLPHLNPRPGLDEHPVPNRSCGDSSPDEAAPLPRSGCFSSPQNPGTSMAEPGSARDECPPQSSKPGQPCSTVLHDECNAASIPKTAGPVSGSVSSRTSPSSQHLLQDGMPIEIDGADSLHCATPSQDTQPTLSGALRDQRLPLVSMPSERCSPCSGPMLAPAAICAPADAFFRGCQPQHQDAAAMGICDQADSQTTATASHKPFQDAAPKIPDARAQLSPSASAIHRKRQDDEFTHDRSAIPHAAASNSLQTSAMEIDDASVHHRAAAMAGQGQHQDSTNRDSAGNDASAMFSEPNPAAVVKATLTAAASKQLPEGPADPHAAAAAGHQDAAAAVHHAAAAIQTDHHPAAILDDRDLVDSSEADAQATSVLALASITETAALADSSDRTPGGHDCLCPAAFGREHNHRHQQQPNNDRTNMAETAKPQPDIAWSSPHSNPKQSTKLLPPPSYVPDETVPANSDGPQPVLELVNATGTVDQQPQAFMSMDTPLQPSMGQLHQRPEKRSLTSKSSMPKRAAVQLSAAPPAQDSKSLHIQLRTLAEQGLTSSAKESIPDQRSPVQETHDPRPTRRFKRMTGLEVLFKHHGVSSVAEICKIAEKQLSELRSTTILPDT